MTYPDHTPFVEPQWSVASKGTASPQWQVFVGFNAVFK